MRKLIATAAFVILMPALVLVAWQTINAYDYYANFPQAQRVFLASMIASGKLQHCDGEDRLLEKNRENTSRLLNSCVRNSTLTSEYLYTNPMSAEDDQIILTYSCRSQDISGRFRFVQNRSDQRVWCDYTTARNLDEIPLYKPEDVAITADPPNTLVKALVWLFG